MIRALPRPLRALAMLVLAGAAVTAVALPPGTPDEIHQRIEPFGTLRTPGDTGEGAQQGQEQAQQAAQARGGQEVYESYCATCHANGVAGAPMLGDASAWNSRIDKGMDVLYEHTFQGFNAMPPRGTCPDCSDEELREAVDYMVAQVE